MATCSYCTLTIRKPRRDSKCVHGEQYHLRCFNEHRKNCNACSMLKGKAGR